MRLTEFDALVPNASAHIYDYLPILDIYNITKISALQERVGGQSLGAGVCSKTISYGPTNVSIVVSIYDIHDSRFAIKRAYDLFEYNGFNMLITTRNEPNFPELYFYKCNLLNIEDKQCYNSPEVSMIINLSVEDIEEGDDNE